MVLPMLPFFTTRNPKRCLGLLDIALSARFPIAKIFIELTLTYGDNLLKLFWELLIIVILSFVKNFKTQLKSIQRCFASLNMTFLEQAF